jgi:hypothetical protein
MTSETTHRAARGVIATRVRVLISCRDANCKRRNRGEVADDGHGSPQEQVLAGAAFGRQALHFRTALGRAPAAK